MLDLKEEIKKINTSSFISGLSDLEKLYVENLKILVITRFEEQNQHDLSNVFDLLGRVYVRKGQLVDDHENLFNVECYTDAAKFFQYVVSINKRELQRIKEKNIDIEVIQSKTAEAESRITEAYNQLDEINQKLIELVTGSGRYQTRHSIFYESSLDKLRLQELRERSKLQLAELDSYLEIADSSLPEEKSAREKVYTERSRSLFEYITIEMKAFLADLYRDAQAILGESPCSYSIIGLGSMALQQVTPYSDLEFAILIEDEDYKQSTDPRIRNYFTYLTHLVHFRVINLGESIIPISKYNVDLSHLIRVGVNFDLGGKTPLGRIDKDKPYSLIQTPEKMVRYLEDKYFHVDKHLSSIVERCIGVYEYAIGDMFQTTSRSLVEDYKAKVRIFFDDKSLDGIPNYKVRAIKRLKEKSPEYDYLGVGKPGVHEGNLKLYIPQFSGQEYEGKPFNAKKEIYRLIDRLLYDVALYFGIESESVWDGIDKLASEKVISTTEARVNLLFAASFATTLRLRTYQYYNQQKEDIEVFDTNKADTEQTESIFHLSKKALTENGALFKYYYTALPFFDSVVSLVEEENIEGLRDSLLHDKDDIYLGLIFTRLLQYHKAKDSFEKAINSHSGKIHPNYIAIYAHLLSSVGKHYESLEIYNQLLTIVKGKHGEIHVNVALCLISRGYAYNTLGDISEAIEDYKGALSILVERYPNNKKEIGMCHLNLGNAYSEQGLPHLQREYIFASLKYIDEKEDPYHYILYLTTVSTILVKEGNFDQAINNNNEAIEIINRNYGSRHQLLTICFNNLANIYTHQSNYIKAIEYYEKSLEITLLIYGEYHKSTAEKFNNLAAIYGNIGKYEEKRKALEHSLSIFLKLFESPHPSIAHLLNNLGESYGESGDFDKQIFYQELALSDYRDLYKNNALHSDIAMCLNNLGNAYGEKGDHEKALELLLEALKIFETDPTSHNVEIVQCLNNIGEHYREIKRYEEQVEYQNRALNIAIDFYKSRENDMVAMCISNLGNGYNALKRYSQQIELQEEALSIYKAIYKSYPSQDSIIICLNSLVDAYLNIGEFYKALRYMNEAVLMCEECEVAEHLIDIIKSNSFVLYCSLIKKEFTAEIRPILEEMIHSKLQSFNVIYTADNINEIFEELQQEVDSSGKIIIGSNIYGYYLLGKIYISEGKIVEVEELLAKFMAEVLEENKTNGLAINNKLVAQLLRLRNRERDAEEFEAIALSLKETEPISFPKKIELSEQTIHDEEVLRKSMLSKIEEIEELVKISMRYSKKTIKDLLPRAHILGNKKQYLKVANKCLDELKIRDDQILDKMIIPQFSTVVGSINLSKDKEKQWFVLFFSYYNKQLHVVHYNPSGECITDNLYTYITMLTDHLKERNIAVIFQDVQIVKQKSFNDSGPLVVGFAQRLKKLYSQLLNHRNAETDVSIEKIHSCLVENVAVLRLEYQEQLYGNLIKDLVIGSSEKVLEVNRCDKIMDYTPQVYNRDILVRIFAKIGANYVSRGRIEKSPELIIEASKYWQYVISLCEIEIKRRDEDTELLSFYQQEIKEAQDALRIIKREFITIVTNGMSVQGQQDIIGIANNDKRILVNLRKKVESELRTIDVYLEQQATLELAKIRDRAFIRHTRSLYEMITMTMKGFLALLFEQSQFEIGQPPCHYAVIGLGSLALKQITPYSDFEFAILTDNEDYKKSTDIRVRDYFTNLCHLVHFRIINLGETVIPTSRYGVDLPDLIRIGVNFDLGGKTPLGRIEKDKPYSLIQIPEKMAIYQEEQYIHVDKVLSYILETCVAVHEYYRSEEEKTEKSLIQDYQDRVKAFLESKNSEGVSYYQARALKRLTEDSAEFDYLGTGSAGKLRASLKAYEPKLVGLNEGKTFNVKHELYRLVDRFLFDLAFYHEIHSQSIWEAIKCLKDNEVIGLSEEASDADFNLLYTASFAVVMRLKTYLYYAQQKDLVELPLLDESKISGALERSFKIPMVYLEEDGVLFKYYYTVLPLYNSLFRFCGLKDIKSRTEYFIRENFYKCDFKIKGDIFSRIRQYQQAFDMYEQCVKSPQCLSIEDQAKIYNDLGAVSGELGNNRDKIKWLTKAKKILEREALTDKEIYFDVLLNLGCAYGDDFEYKKKQEVLEALLPLVEDNNDLKIMTLLELGDVSCEMSDEIGYSKLEEALKMAREFYEHDSLERAIVLQKIGYFKREKFGAIKFLSEARIIAEKRLGTTHPFVGSLLENLATKYADIVNYQEAIDLLMQALRIFQNVRDKREVSRVLTTLGEVYVRNGNVDEGITALREALIIKEAEFGLHNEEYIITLSNLGEVYNYLNSMSESADEEDEDFLAQQIYYDRKAWLEIENLDKSYLYIKFVPVLIRLLDTYLNVDFNGNDKEYFLNSARAVLEIASEPNEMYISSIISEDLYIIVQACSFAKSDSKKYNIIRDFLSRVLSEQYIPGENFANIVFSDSNSIDTKEDERSSSYEDVSSQSYSESSSSEPYIDEDLAAEIMHMAEETSSEIGTDIIESYEFLLEIADNEPKCPTNIKLFLITKLQNLCREYYESNSHVNEAEKYLDKVHRYEERAKTIKEEELINDNEEHNSDVAGIVCDRKLSMKTMDLEINSVFLGIDIIRKIPDSEDGYKFLIIDSDAVIREYAYNREDLIVIYRNIQGNTASCGDNSLLYAKQAALASFQAYIYIQNNHAVTLVKYPNTIGFTEVIDQIVTTEMQENEDLWQYYKYLMIGVGEKRYSQRSLGIWSSYKESIRDNTDCLGLVSAASESSATTDYMELILHSRANLFQDEIITSSDKQLPWFSSYLKTWIYRNEISQLKKLLQDKDITMSWHESLYGNNYRKISPKLHPDKGGSTKEFQFYNDFRQKFNDQDIEPIIQELQLCIHRTAHQLSVTFRTLDIGVDVVRTYYKPTVRNIADLAIGGTHLLSMTTRVTKVSTVASFISIGYTYYENGIYDAAKSVTTLGMFMVAPYALTFINIPYVGLVYTLGITAYTGVNLAKNIWSLYLELTSKETGIESVQAYQELYQKISDLMKMEWFSDRATDYDIVLESIKQELQQEGKTLDAKDIAVVGDDVY